MMTKEEKQELTEAVCGYLPHGLKVTTKTPSWDGVYDVLGYQDFTERIVYLDCPVYDEGDDEWRIERVTPYLRPMESMSEGERDYYSQKLQAVAESVVRRQKHIEELTDWLNKNKFDWRGLIPKGLALPAADGMYEQRIKTE